MDLQFRNKRVSGTLTVVPELVRHFEDEAENYDFTAAQRTQLTSLMGYNTHRVVSDPEICVSDLCLWGLKHLFQERLLVPEEIDGLILVTQTPDFLVPATSSVIHGRAGLKRDCFCLDINQGCTGFNVGLIQAFMLLEQPTIDKVVVLNADILSRKVSVKDKSSYPLIGDAASITVVERSSSESEALIHANIQNDGTRCDAMKIPAGGLRMPSSVETASLTEDGGVRARDHLVTKGDVLFSFVQTEVPPMIMRVLKAADLSIADIDYFMFHQPNKFALTKLAAKLGVDSERIPSSVVENLGNPSSASIPAAMAYDDDASEALTSGTHRLCLAGFGVGLSMSAMLINAGPMDFCKLIEMPC